MIATSQNVIGIAVAAGVLLGAGIVLATLWVVTHEKRRFP